MRIATFELRSSLDLELQHRNEKPASVKTPAQQSADALQVQPCVGGRVLSVESPAPRLPR